MSARFSAVMLQSIQIILSPTNFSIKLVILAWNTYYCGLCHWWHLNFFIDWCLKNVSIVLLFGLSLKNWWITPRVSSHQFHFCAFLTVRCFILCLIIRAYTRNEERLPKLHCLFEISLGNSDSASLKPLLHSLNKTLPLISHYSGINLFSPYSPLKETKA